MRAVGCGRLELVPVSSSPADYTPIRHQVSLPLANVSAAFTATRTVCAKELYTGKALPPMKPGVPLVAALPVHDSAMFCVWQGAEKGGCGTAAANDCP